MLKANKLTKLNTTNRLNTTNKLTTSITNTTKRLNYLALSLLITLTSILPILLQASANAAPSTPPDSCFSFNSGTQTIEDYYDYEGNNNSNPACPRAVDIPATIGGTAVTIIGSAAFLENQLTAVTIPNSVTTIGNYAFKGNQLTAVTIPNSTTTIGEGAFENNQINSLIIPDSITNLSNYAFRGNQLSFLDLPNNITTIGVATFTENQLTSLTIPNSVTTIGNEAFANNQLTSVTLGNSVTTIGTLAFMANKITSLIIPSSVTTIGDIAFQANSIDEVTIPDSVTSLGLMVFNSQTKEDGTDYMDFMSSGSDPQVAQDWIDSVIYVNIYASSSQVSALGLADSTVTEAILGGDINTDGDQADILSGQLINPAHITATYKDTEGNTIAPSTTATGTGLTTYLIKDNPTNNLGLYYRAGDSYTVPTAPTIAGYEIVTTPSNIASLSAGDNQINYVYKAVSNGNNDGNNNSTSNTANLTTPTSPISAFSLRPVSISTPTGTNISSSSTVPESSLVTQDPNNQYPLGLVNFSFTTNQSSNQVVLNFETDLKPNQVTARKYNSNTNTYNNLPISANPTITETTINNKHHLTLTYTLIDNGELDLDPTTGIIKDPVGLAVTNQTYNQLANTGTNNTLPIVIAISMVTIASGSWILSRRRKGYSILG